MSYHILFYQELVPGGPFADLDAVHKRIETFIWNELANPKDGVGEPFTLLKEDSRIILGIKYDRHADPDLRDSSI